MKNSKEKEPFPKNTLIIYLDIKNETKNTLFAVAALQNVEKFIHTSDVIVDNYTLNLKIEHRRNETSRMLNID